jgi:rod shape-determining protein MreD
MARKGRPEPPMGFMRQLDSGARAVFPTALTTFLLVMAAVPVGVPGLMTAVAVPSVFFWTVFRPGAMPPPVVFMLGLLHDLLGFTPLGTGVLTLLLVHGVALRGRGWLARASFLWDWLAFCGVAAGAALLGWMLQALLGWNRPPIMPGVYMFGVMAGAYPALALVLSRMHMAMRRAEDALP